MEVLTDMQQVVSGETSNNTDKTMLDIHEQIKDLKAFLIKENKRLQDQVLKIWELETPERAKFLKNSLYH